MLWKRAIRRLCFSIVACMAVFGLAAAEHHGQVKFNGVPVPGATVTATQGDKKQIAVTDLQGDYAFPDLAEGVWAMQVEMLCFETLKKDIGVSADAPSPEWDLKLLPLDQMKAVAAPPLPPRARGGGDGGRQARCGSRLRLHRRRRAARNRPRRRRPTLRPGFSGRK